METNNQNYVSPDLKVYEVKIRKRICDLSVQNSNVDDADEVDGGEF